MDMAWPWRPIWIEKSRILTCCTVMEPATGSRLFSATYVILSQHFDLVALVSAPKSISYSWYPLLPQRPNIMQRVCLSGSAL